MAAVVVLLLGAIGLALDLDRDGASGYQELGSATNPFDGDSDGDGLADGWEEAHGLDPRDRDSDGDGLEDGLEVEYGSDPLATDSDRDGLPDAEEDPTLDCDADGIPAIVEGDDDADGRIDGLETAAERCDPDSDNDGVPDGYEGNVVCVHLVDCDNDGLADGDEGEGFSPLDPDSFDSGVSDSISQAFQASGQPSGSDRDLDGIPDGWESSDGLIEWGDLRPVDGERDFLVEFVRVVTPDSSRSVYSRLDYEDSYALVAAAFAREQGIQMRWTETVVELDEEASPPLIPTVDDPYYDLVLRHARHSENAYVTTVVMNPKHDQSQIPHLGVAPIRGMLAAVVYAGHVEAHFESEDGGSSVTLPVILESFIQDDTFSGLTMGSGPNAIVFNDLYQDPATGRIVLRSDSRGWTMSWEPSWFRSAPRLEDDEGNHLDFLQTGATLDEQELAFTIQHEIGHTLGLCHTDVPACSAEYSFRDRLDQAESTMSYDNDEATLHFLDSEWDIVNTYLTCPPQAPLAELARGGSGSAIRDAKYAYSEQTLDDVELRQCSVFDPLAYQFAPGSPAPESYVQPASYASAPSGGGPGLTIGFTLLALGAAGLAGWAWATRRHG